MSPAAEKCRVLVPAYTHAAIEPETKNAIQHLANRGYDVRFLFGCSQIDLARSILATYAMRDGFEETMWIDADVAFDPDDVDRLRSHNLPMTAGLYPKKGRPEFAGKFLPGDKMTFGKGGGLLEVCYAGMGFTHIRREVFDKIRTEQKLPACGGGYDPAKPVTPYFIPTLAQDGNGWTYLSEDYSFCHRAKLAGFKVWADTTIKLGHAHRHILTWDDFIPRQTYEAMEFGITERAAE